MNRRGPHTYFTRRTTMYGDKETNSSGISRAQALKAVSLPLDDLAKSLENARERILVNTRHVQSLADGLLGAEPEGNNSGAAPPPRLGKVGNLNDQADILHGCIGELERQLSRLAPLQG
jgi:hypothetical protein